MERSVALEEAKLVERAKNGEAAAYERLVKVHQKIAFRAAYLILRDAPEAEDATQEAFVKAYRALDGFRPGASFKPWLLSIVTNEAKNRRKAAGRRAGLVLRAEREAASSSHPSPEADVVATERLEELLAALEEMREEDRAVISHRYFLDLSERETATALGCARGTVKSRLSRAMGRLRERMVKDAG
ncbi:MAG: RNA polymerase sigma factor [Rubrobacteraceae bacterium]